MPKETERTTEQSRRQIENAFVYHSPNQDQTDRYIRLRDKAKELAHLIDESCPGSREKSLALTKLEESIMWANAAIARNEKDEGSAART